MSQLIRLLLNLPLAFKILWLYNTDRIGNNFLKELNETGDDLNNDADDLTILPDVNEQRQLKSAYVTVTYIIPALF